MMLLCSCTSVKTRISELREEYKNQTIINTPKIENTPIETTPVENFPKEGQPIGIATTNIKDITSAPYDIFCGKKDMKVYVEKNVIYCIDKDGFKHYYMSSFANGHWTIGTETFE
jgi:hypothetical protein